MNVLICITYLAHLFQQLTEALLAMEEVKAIRSSVEKASIQSIKEASESHNAKISLLSSEVLQVILCISFLLYFLRIRAFHYLKY